MRAAASDVGFDQELAATAKAHTIDLQILHDPLDVIACFGNRNSLDPIDGIDVRVARVAIGRDLLFHPAAAGVVAGEGEDVGTVVAA